MKTVTPLLLLLLLILPFSACHKEEVSDIDDNTSIGYLAGTWDVTLDAIDADGNLIWNDAEFYQLGQVQIRTYSAGQQVKDSLWLEDVDGAIWNFRVKIGCDIDSGTLSLEDGENRTRQTGVHIEQGRIIKDAARLADGTTTDSIYLYILFSDDNEASLYYDFMRISGHRTQEIY